MKNLFKNNFLENKDSDNFFSIFNSINNNTNNDYLNLGVFGGLNSDNGFSLVNNLSNVSNLNYVNPIFNQMKNLNKLHNFSNKFGKNPFVTTNGCNGGVGNILNQMNNINISFNNSHNISNNDNLNATELKEIIMINL